MRAEPEVFRPLAQELRDQVLDLHRKTWLQRSRPGGLDASCAHYQRLIDELTTG